jgi:hypothetical protein
MMTNENKLTLEKYNAMSFFDGMSNDVNKTPEKEIIMRVVKIGDKVIQEEKECIVIATPEEPKGFIIPDKYYCIVKEIATSRKFFLKL